MSQDCWRQLALREYHTYSSIIESGWVECQSLYLSWCYSITHRQSWSSAWSWNSIELVWCLSLKHQWVFGVCILLTWRAYPDCYSRFFLSRWRCGRTIQELQWKYRLSGGQAICHDMSLSKSNIQKRSHRASSWLNYSIISTQLHLPVALSPNWRSCLDPHSHSLSECIYNPLQIIAFIDDIISHQFTLPCFQEGKKGVWLRRWAQHQVWSMREIANIIISHIDHSIGSTYGQAPIQVYGCEGAGQLWACPSWASGGGLISNPLL